MKITSVPVQQLASARLATRAFLHSASASSQATLHRLTPVSLRIGISCVLAFFLTVLNSMPARATPVTTSTNLSLSSGSVLAGTVVTLTATVAPATRGSVDFCLASATFCTGSNRLQTVQVSTSGTAIFRKVFGAGNYSFKAVFRGTSSLATSSSSAHNLTVTGNGSYATSTVIAAQGTPGNYSLTGTVTSSGRALTTGTVSFLDTTASNVVVGASVLDPLTASFGFTTYPAVSAPSYRVATGDFNEDGKVDIATASGGITVALGNGDGSFTTPVGYGAVSNTRNLVVYDINGDGHLDIVAVGSNAVSNFQSYVAVLLGNGDGTFQPAQTFYAGHDCEDVAVGDLNGDGYPDVITVNAGDNQVGIFLGNGSGTFQANSPIGVSGGLYGVAVADLNGDGNLDIVATTGVGMSILLGTGNASFATAVPYAAGLVAKQAVIGDFNGDGKLDIATANFTDNDMTVMLGNGDGTFQTPVAYSTNVTSSGYGSEPYSITGGDFNGDGIEDIAVGTLFQQGAFFLGKGDGTFQSAGGLNAIGPSYYAFNEGIASADFDGDGLDDLTVSLGADGLAGVLMAQHTESATATGVSVSGPATQQVEASYPGDTPHAASVSVTTPLQPLPSTTLLSSTPLSTTPGNPVTLSATVSPTPTGSGTAGTVSFYSGGTLLSTINVTGANASYVTTNLPAGNSTITAVYSGNVVLASSNSNVLRIFVGPQTSLTLSTSTSTAVAGTPVVLTATGTRLPGASPLTAGQVSFTYQQTVNGTLISGSFGSAQLTSAGTAALAVRPGAGTYVITASFAGTATSGPSTSASQPLTIGGNGSYGSATSLVSSGSVDDYTLSATVSGFGLIAPSGTLSFLNTTSSNQSIATAVIDPSTTVQGLIPSSNSPLANTNVHFVATGDFNNDGISDYAIVTSDGKVVVQLGLGSGLFQSTGTYPISTSLNGLVTGDVNGDGKLDLVAISSSDSTVSVLLGNGDGTFQTPGSSQVLAAPDGPSFLAIADLNGDGLLDLVETGSSAGTVGVFLGNGDGTFRAEQTYGVGSGPNSVVIADFNADGSPDLAVSNQNDGTISILLGVGDGSFHTQTTLNYPWGDSAGILAAGSLRTNGAVDLIAPDLYDPAIFVFLGNNDGTFTSPARYDINGNSVGQAALVDVNHDGKLDMVATYNNQIALLVGAGDGTFGSEQDFSTGNGVVNVALADFNSDGLIDFITSDSGDNTTTILLGQQSVTATASAVYTTGTGTQLVDASFPGDATHAASLSNTVSLDPSVQALSSTLLTASSQSIAAGSSVTFTANVTPVPTGATYGTFGFYIGGTLLGSVPANANGAASYSTTALPAGSDAITAIYSGNAALGLSASDIFTETVTISTATQLSSPTPTSVHGQSLTVTASVTPAPTGSLRGSVSLYQGGTLLGTGALDANGNVSIPVTTLPIGLDTITGVYSGNGTYTTSTSGPLSISVNARTTAVVLTSTVPASMLSGGNAGMQMADIKDEVGTTVTSSTALVTAAIIGPNGYSQSVTNAAVNGVATLNLSSLPLTTPGTYTLTFSSAGLTSAIASMTVTAGSASQLATSAVPSTLVSGSNPGTLTATIKDANGNTVTSSTAPVTTTITGPNGYSQSVSNAAVNGVATLNLSSLALNVAGTYTVTTSSPGLPSATASVMVVPGTAAQITVSPAPSPLARGGNVGSIIGTIKDANGNTSTNSSLPVTATITGPGSYSQAMTVPAANGQVTFNLGSLPLPNAGTYTLMITGAGLAPVTQTITVAKTTSTIAWTSPAAIGYGTPLSATQLNATASVAGTFAYNPAAGVTLPAGINSLSVTFTPTDASNYTTANGSVQLLVQAPSTTTLAASNSTQLASMPLTFTAQVNSGFAGTKTGSVSFFDGSTLLGTSALNVNAVATYTTTSLGDGSHTITAAYSGDANYLASTSSSTAAIVTVADVNLNLGGDQNQSVVPGAAVSYNFPLSPLVTPTFLYDVHLTATGLPPGATYTFTPATIPAGSASMPVTLTVQTAKNVASLSSPSKPGGRNTSGRDTALALGFFLPLLGFSSVRRRLKTLPRPLTAVLVTLASLAAVAGLSGCGAGGFFGSTASSGKYTITVTATSGSLVRSSTVTLTIQ